jgi:hypothetical protein
MPATFNFNQPIAVDSSGLIAQSVRYWAYPSNTAYVANGTPTNTSPAEVPIQNAHIVIWDLFTGKNETGTFMGRATWGNSNLSVQQYFAGMTVDQIIANIYPPPGSDT